TPNGVSSPGSVAASSTTTTLPTISISNSTGLGSIWTIENRSGLTFEFPTLDPKTGQIYALSATKNGTNRLLTAFDTTRLEYRTVQAVPGTGIGLAVDPSTNEIYVAVAPPCDLGSAPSICSPNQGGVMRVNGSTGA